MNNKSSEFTKACASPRRREQARIHINVVGLICFLLGLAGGAYLVFHTVSPRAAINTASTSEYKLSEGTKAVLNSLESSVTIRFYSVLDPASVPASVSDYTKRVSQLLSLFQIEAQGRIKVVRLDTVADSVSKSATADGIKPFNLDKGDACYLGMAIACKDQKESFAQLSPDWEPALEFDISRAIAHVTAKPQVSAPQAAEPGKIEDVKHLLPDVATISVAEGTRILREKTLANFTATTKEMGAKITEAEQRLVRARNNNSEVEQQAAMEEIQRLRAEQSEKLQQIAARLHDQIAALELMKQK